MKYDAILKTLDENQPHISKEEDYFGGYGYSPCWLYSDYMGFERKVDEENNKVYLEIYHKYSDDLGYDEYYYSSETDYEYIVENFVSKTVLDAWLAKENEKLPKVESKENCFAKLFKSIIR